MALAPQAHIFRNRVKAAPHMRLQFPDIRAMPQYNMKRT